VHDIPRLGGHCIQMTGSNTMWFALLRISPAQDKAIVVTTNSGAPNAFATCNQAVVAAMPDGGGGSNARNLSSAHYSTLPMFLRLPMDCSDGWTKPL